MSDIEPFAEESAAPPAEVEPAGSPSEIEGSGPRRVEELPPVEPPSAGFIVQLFLIPMLIVGVIVGVYALFGRIAGGEQDWRTLVTELKNANEHRRWRAAVGLAHLLKVDADRGEVGQQLSKNPEIAKALLEVLEEQKSAKSKLSEEKYLNQQQYLITALGYLDQPKTVIPPLQEFIRETSDRNEGMRIEALRSIFRIADRTTERAEAENRPLLVEELVEIPSLVEDVVQVSREPEPLFRQVAAFALGFLPSPESRQRLEVMLNDSDTNAKINAAIGLSRQDSTAGWPVYLEVLQGAEEHPAEQEGMNLVIVKNILKAVGDLDEKWSDEENRQLTGLLESISENHANRRIRTDAKKTLQTLQGDG